MPWAKKKVPGKLSENLTGTNYYRRFQLMSAVLGGVALSVLAMACHHYGPTPVYYVLGF